MGINKSSLFWVEGILTLNDFWDHHKLQSYIVHLIILVERQLFPFSESKRLRAKETLGFSPDHIAQLRIFFF